MNNFKIALAAILGGVIVLVGGCAAFTGFTSPEAGQISVIRNGGPLDNREIRSIIQPGSGIQWIGMMSKPHPYPAQQRFYTITADGDGDRKGADVVQTPTSDGVEVGLEGTIYFTLNQSSDALKRFDEKFGTRTFDSIDGSRYYPWEGDEGWSAFLDKIVRPVIINDLRAGIAELRCAELVSSCALVQNSGQRQVDPDAGEANNANIAKVQSAINRSLPINLREQLGGDFLTDIRFSLVRVTLPENVQEAVNSAQAAFAEVSEAQARVQSARADATANSQRQRGYQECPACAKIDQLKAIPPSLKTYAPGSGFSVTP